MKKNNLPSTDSIEELAKFWDTHDVTDFEDELEEVTEPIFVRRKAIRVPLESAEAEAVKKLAKAMGVSQAELVRGWVLQHILQGDGHSPGKRQPTAKGRRKQPPIDLFTE